MIKYDYSGKTVLVTGSSRGIGYSTARMFLDSGARVMINGVNNERLETDKRILKGPFLCSQLAARQMIKQGKGGKIVNVSSGSWKVARVGASAYCASKAGIVMFSGCLAQELGPHGINVNVVAPGLIDVGEEQTPAKVAYEQATVRMTPWGRIGKPEDIAHAILMLCSPQADYMTGAVVSVDGGLSVGRYGIPVSP